MTKYLLPALLLAGCQSQSPALELAHRYQPGAPRAYVAKVSENATPAAFRVAISLQEGFRTLLNNQPGELAADRSQIQAFRVLLLRRNEVPGPGSVSAKAGPFTVPVDLGSGGQALTFSDVEPGSYFVCAAAFDSASSFTQAHNLTGELPHHYAEGPCALSSGGGLGNSGRIVVNSDFSIEGADQLTVQLPLRDLKGATFDTRVEVLTTDDD